MENRNAGKSGPEMTPGKTPGNSPENKTPKKAPSQLPKISTKADELMTALGAMAESAHIFYSAMMGAGASFHEATVGMTAYITGSLIAGRMPGNGGTETDRDKNSQPDG